MDTFKSRRAKKFAWARVRRTHAETAFVQLLLQILRTVNTFIRTPGMSLNSYLLNDIMFRPPPLMLPSGAERLAELKGRYIGSTIRANDRLYRTVRLGDDWWGRYSGILGWPHLERDDHEYREGNNFGTIQ